jgi:hypothetical protein
VEKSLRQSDWSGQAAASAVFLLCAFLLALPWTSGAYTIPWDAKAHFQPQFAFLAHALHSGQSPFWTPNVFTGMPQIADPQSLIFAPFFLAAAWLVPEPSFQLEDGLIFAMLAMGGLALIAYFADRGWSAAGAVIAALAFAFGGSAAWRIQHTGQVMSLAWFPVSLWLLARALDRRSAAYGAGAGVVAAFMVLGRDQVALLCVMILAAYALYRIAIDDTRWTSAVLPLSAGAVAGSAIIVLPLLWTLALAADSNRPEIDLDGAFKGSLPPGSFLTLVVANLFGVDGPLKDFWGPPSSVFGTTDIFLARNMATVYMGALPVLLLVAAVRQGFWAEREMRFFVPVAVFLALYALGRYTPAFQLMFHIPGVDLYRRPADATFPLGAVLAIIAGYSFDAFARGAAKPRLGALTVAAAGLLAIAAGVALAKDRLAMAAGPLLGGALFWALALGVVALAGRLRGARPALLLCAAAAALTLDLALSNEPNESTALPPQKFDVLRADSANETLAHLRRKLAESAAPDRRDRVELAAIDFHWPNATMVHGLDHDLGYNPIRLKLFEDATGAGDHVALPEQRQFSKLYPAYRSPLTDLMGVRVIATGVPIDRIDKSATEADFPLIARTSDAYIYENPRALPRILTPICAMSADFSRMIEEGGWPDVDFQRTVLLEKAPVCGAARDAAEALARIKTYENTRVVVEAQAPEGGSYIVLNDIWHPWWFASVDGQPAEMLRANVIFRAVAIPAGSHEVRFEFHPLRGVLRGFQRG